MPFEGGKWRGGYGLVEEVVLPSASRGWFLDLLERFGAQVESFDAKGLRLETMFG